MGYSLIFIRPAASPSKICNHTAKAQKAINYRASLKFAWLQKHGAWKSSPLRDIKPKWYNQWLGSRWATVGRKLTGLTGGVLGYGCSRCDCWVQVTGQGCRRGVLCQLSPCYHGLLTYGERSLPLRHLLILPWRLGLSWFVTAENLHSVFLY